MELSKAMENRFSVRKFKAEKISEEHLSEILAAGHVAPTACNFQPQKILVIDGEEELGKLRSCTSCHFNAPCALLVCYDETECWTRPFDGQQSGHIDASIVTTHMMLRAHSLGVGSTWVMYFEPEKIAEKFNLPKNYVPTAILVMGYPADDAPINPKHKNKRPMSETVFRNKF